jgi:hypothetical protein
VRAVIDVNGNGHGRRYVEKVRLRQEEERVSDRLRALGCIITSMPPGVHEMTRALGACGSRCSKVQECIGRERRHMSERVDVGGA